MKPTFARLASIAALLTGLMFAQPAHAQFTIDFDAVIDFDIGWTFVDIVDSLTPPTHVSVVPGGVIYKMNVYGISEFTMTGGDLRYDMNLYDNSRATITGTDGGSVRLGLYNNAQTSVTLPNDKSVSLIGHGNSQFTLDGGTFDGYAGIGTYDNATGVIANFPYYPPRNTTNYNLSSSRA